MTHQFEHEKAFVENGQHAMPRSIELFQRVMDQEVARARAKVENRNKTEGTKEKAEEKEEAEDFGYDPIGEHELNRNFYKEHWAFPTIAALLKLTTNTELKGSD